MVASQTATNGGDGLTWATAFNDLQNALTYPCSQSVTEIWVAAGVYKPTSNTADRGASFAMRNGLKIYGGFVGSTPSNPTGETAINQRPAINPINDNPGSGQPSSSTLSGDINNDGTLAGNSFHVIKNPASLSLNNTAELNGFVITGGNASGGGDERQGGAILNSRSNPTITHCSFLSNEALNGGAICNDINSNPTLTNSLFRNNSAVNGGAIYNYSNSSPTITHCSFQSNTATGSGSSSGGGAILNSSSNPTIGHCSFQNNWAIKGGGIFSSSSSVVLINASFLSNTATNQGGATWVEGGSLAVVNCVFWNNGGNNSLFNYHTSASATYSLFDNVTNIDVSGPGNLTTITSPFVSTASVALATCSPAINAGDPTSQTAATGPYSVTALPQTDLAGQPRIFGPRVDMGAVEFQGVGGPVTSFTLTLAGSATATCAASPTITLSGSQTGVSYQLLRDGDNAGSPLTGTGNALNFGPQSASGIYSVLATNISSSCSAVMEGSVTVVSDAALPTVSLAPAPSTTLTCSQTSVTLTATASVTALRWSHGPTNTSALTVNQPGSYWVTATAPNGCSVVSNTVVVNQNVGLVATLTASNTGLCAGGSALLTATVGAGLPGVDYRFSGPGGLAQNGPTNTLSATQTGAYSVTVTGANGCTATQQVSLTVSAGPVAQLTYLNDGRTVQVTGGSSYQLVQPMVTINGVYQLRETFESTNGFFELKRPGPFWVIVTSQNGCSTRVDGSAP